MVLFFKLELWWWEISCLTSVSRKVLRERVRPAWVLESKTKSWSKILNKIIKIKSIFESIGYVYKIGKFEGIYRRAKEIVKELVYLSKAMMRRSQCGLSRKQLKKCTILIDNINIYEPQRKRKQNFQWSILHQEKDQCRLPPLFMIGSFGVVFICQDSVT